MCWVKSLFEVNVSYKRPTNKLIAVIYIDSKHKDAVYLGFARRIIIVLVSNAQQVNYNVSKMDESKHLAWYAKQCKTSIAAVPVIPFSLPEKDDNDPQQVWGKRYQISSWTACNPQAMSLPLSSAIHCKYL